MTAAAPTTEDIDALVLRQFEIYALADELLRRWLSEALAGNYAAFGDGAERMRSIVSLVEVVSIHSASLLELRKAVGPMRLRIVEPSNSSEPSGLRTKTRINSAADPKRPRARSDRGGHRRRAVSYLNRDAIRHWSQFRSAT